MQPDRMPQKKNVADLAKVTSDHENRIRAGETNMTKWLGAISVISIVVSVVIAYLLKLV